MGCTLTIKLMAIWQRFLFVVRSGLPPAMSAIMSAQRKASANRGCMICRGVLLFLAVQYFGLPCQANDRGPQQTSGVESAALRLLKGLHREWSGSSNRDCKTYEDKNLERLSPPFAASAAAFLSAFVEVHGHVTITSAHRTAQEQACVCEGEKGPCAGRPRVVKGKKGRRYVKRTTSHHQDGIALDVRAGTGSDEEFTCLHEFAQLNPYFGVHFPMGQRDRPHMEPATRLSAAFRFASLGPLLRKITPCTKMRMMLIDQPLD